MRHEAWLSKIGLETKRRWRLLGEMAILYFILELADGRSFTGMNILNVVGIVIGVMMFFWIAIGLGKLKNMF